jgi:aryl-alcohol dehydrogenase-like predicted oxidoreductase
MKKIAGTELEVFPLCLGGNVFGWTADRKASFAVLDAYVEAGGNFVDTADVYSNLPGGYGLDSEETIGAWHTARGNRDRLLIATKVAKRADRPGLSAENIRLAAEDSLRRLQTDRIDLYYAHHDDEEVPLEETLEAFTTLVDEGKVRYIAASNYDGPRLSEALGASREHGLAEYVALQPLYSLMERDYERDAAPACEREGIACFPYLSLAAGFLSGKYRAGDAPVDSPRAGYASGYLAEPRGPATLQVLARIAEAHGTTMPAVALAWLAAQPTVTAPIASARDTEQFAELLPMLELRLSDDEIAQLRAASG